MGAVTALNYANKDKGISLLIVDSPYSNLSKIAVELASEKTNFPKFLIPTLIAILKKGIKKKIYIKFSQLDLTKKVDKIRVPATFIYSFHDEIVKPIHTETLFQLYGNPEKKMISVNGLHNDARPTAIMKEIGKFCFDQFMKCDTMFKRINSKMEICDIYHRPSLSVNLNGSLNTLQTPIKIVEKNTLIEKNKKFEEEVFLEDDDYRNLSSNMSILSQNETKFFNFNIEKENFIFDYFQAGLSKKNYILFKEEEK